MSSLELGARTGKTRTSTGATQQHIYSKRSMRFRESGWWLIAKRPGRRIARTKIEDAWARRPTDRTATGYSDFVFGLFALLYRGKPDVELVFDVAGSQPISHGTSDVSAQISSGRSATGRTDKIKGGLHALSHRRCGIFGRNWPRAEPGHRPGKSISVLSIKGTDVKVTMGDEVSQVVFTPDGKRALATNPAREQFSERRPYACIGSGRSVPGASLLATGRPSNRHHRSPAESCWDRSRLRCDVGPRASARMLWRRHTHDPAAGSSDCLTLARERLAQHSNA